MFWDLRDSFLSCLYRGSVENARLESFLTHIDTVSAKKTIFFFKRSLKRQFSLLLSVRIYSLISRN